MKSEFSGPVRSIWMSDGRTMLITKTLVFTDAAGKAWTAPVDSIVDGASIPRIAWRMIGSPLCGRYRRASVIHDVYCATKNEPWQAVHRVFAEMMAADGVPAVKRFLMAKAVWFFGPRWEA